MRVSDFHFHLPPELIAKHPPAERDAARMLTFDRATGLTQDRLFRDLPSFLKSGDLVIFNNSRVIPARLFGRRAGLHTQANSPTPTGSIEVLLTEQLNGTDWRTLVKPSRKVQPGETLLFEQTAASESDATGNKGSVILSGAKDSLPSHPSQEASGAPTLSAEVIAAGERGERILHFAPTPDFFVKLDALGHIPLPPYLHRPDTPEDRARYQTVYADPAQPGSAAAPTAGLHFTPEILTELADKGVQTAHVTLHVGLGTFQPVQVEEVADIRLHAEHYTLPAGTADAINQARQEGRRIIAVGTTTVRTLEHCARTAITSTAGGDLRARAFQQLATGTADLATDNQQQRATRRNRLATPDWQLRPHTGSTCIFLKPGDTFQIVDALLTNFHLPESTLLMLVSAFAAQRSTPAAGIQHVLAAYQHAVAEHYRFFSYGDCMFLS